MTPSLKDAHAVRGQNLILEGYLLARSKTHGGGPAPHRQALMLGIMRWEIARRMFRFRLWRAIHWLLLGLLYVRQKLPAVKG